MAIWRGTGGPGDATTDAASEASAAANSATSAAASASAAASSANQAEVALDQFTDLYLGERGSDPTVDLDGNPLQTGALYFSTSAQGIKVYNGSIWLNAYDTSVLLPNNNLSDLDNAATARTNLGVEIGTDVQAYDAQLTDIAGLTPTDSNFIVGDGTNFVLESGNTARTSLGLGTGDSPTFTDLTATNDLLVGSGHQLNVDSSTNRIGINKQLPTATLDIGSTSSDVIGVSKTGVSTVGKITVDTDEIGLYSGGGATSSLTFSTGNSGPLGLASEVARIDGSGNLGIGTTTPSEKLDVSGNIAVSGTVDGRDVATDGTKLDGIEALADVTDTANVTAAGALMDSEVTNLAEVKAFSSADYATAAQGTLADSALQPGDIGSTVQGYDADTAKTDTAQTFTASQRGTVTSDNDLSFDLSATNNFSCTPTAGGTLTFTNHTAGQSGFILLDNSSGYAITAAATTKINATDLTTISTAGVYVLSYFDNGTNAYIMVSRSFA